MSTPEQTMTAARPDDDASTPTDATAGSVAAVTATDVGVRFVTKRRAVEAIGRVDLAVAPGEFVSIVGPSGCGKSTLLRLVAGLVSPSRGSVRVGDEQVDGPRGDIGFVFQRPALLEWRTARNNILLQAEMRGIPMDRARQRADELLEMAGLQGFADAMPYELSGGMQQRVALCRALLHDPQVLLMDEPFGALDALTREHMNNELHRLWRDTGKSVLFVTHSIAEAVFLSNRVIVLTRRPAHVDEVVQIDLPDVRDYTTTMSAPQFAAATTRIRQLLGASSDHD